MCFSQFAQYTERPVKEFKTVRPAGAPLTNAEKDPNLFGAIPAPPEWRVEVEPENSHEHEHEHSHTPNGNGNGHQQVEATQAPAAAVYTSPHPGNGASNGNEIAAVKTQTIEAVVVELANGTKLLICPL